MQRIFNVFSVSGHILLVVTWIDNNLDQNKADLTWTRELRGDADGDGKIDDDEARFNFLSLKIVFENGINWSKILNQTHW